MLMVRVVVAVTVRSIVMSGHGRGVHSNAIIIGSLCIVSWTMTMMMMHEI